MLYGTVIEFLPAKGFGFIRADYGPDVFFHMTALGACQAPPLIGPGQAVKYELTPGTEPNRRRRSKRHDDDDDDTEVPPEPARPHAKLVELIDKIPGGVLKETAESLLPARHPRAKRKKPTWRR